MNRSKFSDARSFQCLMDLTLQHRRMEMPVGAFPGPRIQKDPAGREQPVPGPFKLCMWVLKGDCFGQKNPGEILFPIPFPANTQILQIGFHSCMECSRKQGQPILTSLTGTDVQSFILKIQVLNPKG